MILLLKSYPYHFVRTILSVPFCPIPFCPYTILFIPFCPFHFVRYDFVLEMSWHRVGCCVLLRVVSFWSRGPYSDYAAKSFSVAGLSAWNDLLLELRSFLMTYPAKDYIILYLISFYFGCGWAGSTFE